MVRRRQKRKGGFLLGTLAGIIAGAAGGTMLLRRSSEEESITVVSTEPVTSAAGQARDAARHAFAVAHDAGDQGAARAQGTLDALRDRWRLAMREGRKAANERQRELEAQLAFERKEIPPFEAKLIDAIERRSGDNGNPPAGRSQDQTPPVSSPERRDT